MKRTLNVVVCLLTLVLLVTAMVVGPVSAQGTDARVRLVDAVPDAPAGDVLVDGKVVLSGITFKTISPYMAIASGSHKLQVVPAGATSPVVLDTTITIAAGKDQTVVLDGKLAKIAALVLTDDNSAPPAGQAKVRFVHLAPDAPAADLAVTGGPVVFKNISFGQASDYTAVPASSYPVEIRGAGTTTAVLKSTVDLKAGTVTTAWAVGLLSGTPALSLITSDDTAAAAAAAPSGTSAAAPTTAAKAGGFDPATASSALVSVGGLLLAGSLWIRRRSA